MPADNRIRLAPLDKSHAVQALAWITDPRVNKYMLSGHEPISLEEEERWYDEMAASQTDAVFEIHLAEDDAFIGHAGLNHIDRKHRNAELGIMIGSLPHQGQGYGRDTLVAVLRHAFDVLGLHRVGLRCHPENTRGIAAYRAVGFTEVGHEREAVFIDGEFQAHLVFDILEDEFRSRYGDSR